MKLLLLDLDGTIRRSTIGEFINDPSDQEPIEGAIESLEFAQKQGWAMIGITNQAGVAAGYKTLKSAILEQKKTLEIWFFGLSYATYRIIRNETLIEKDIWRFLSIIFV
jgi:D-glycero-D-manno-heptose 1,7-bisphosphate phosphatase